MIATILKNNWYYIVVGLTVAALSLMLSIATDQRDDARSALATAQAQIALKDQLIAQQNEGIDRVVAQRAEDRKAYLEGIRAANRQAINLEVDAAELLRLPTPPADEQCAAAETLMRKELTSD